MSRWSSLRAPGARPAACAALLVWALSPGCAAAPGGQEPPAASPSPGARATPAAAPEEPQGESRRDMRRATVEMPHGRSFVAEIADTPERQERGYMFRREIGENDAMIFVFPESGLHLFWMKNTLVPLDMIWLDDAFGVVYIENGAPPCRADPCPGYGPVRKSRYVVEVRGGTAAREGLRIGDRLRVSFPQPAA